MAKYGEYSGINDCVIAVYKSGKLQHLTANVNPETVFLDKEYCNDGTHNLEFIYTENGTELKALIEITMKHSFRVFPSWMYEQLEKQFYN